MDHVAHIRAACENCGFVGSYQVPYKAKIVDYDGSYDEGASHVITWLDKNREILLCSNCGLPKLEVVYWDQTKIEDPFVPSLRFKKND